MAVQILSNPLLTYAPHGVDPTGMQLFTYAAGTNTKKATYTSTDKGTEHTNPIVLNSKGQPNNGSPVVIDGSYKFVIAPADDTDPPASGTVLADNYSSDLVSSVTGNFNLVTNGSFEDDTNGDGTPDGFTIAELTGGSIAIDTTDVAHGTNSLLFTSASAGGGTATSEDYFPVLAGSTVNGIVSVKSSSATNHNIVEVYWYTSAGTYLSKTSIYDKSTGNPTTWTQYNTTMTVPATAVQAKLVLTGVAADSTTLASSVRFDDVKVQDVSGVRSETVGALTTTEVALLDGSTSANSVASVAPVLDSDKGQLFSTDGPSTPNLYTVYKNNIIKVLLYSNSSGTIQKDFNVASINHSATGTYDITFSTSLPDANYSWSVETGTFSASGSYAWTTSRTTSGLTVKTYDGSGGGGLVAADRDFSLIII